MTGFGVGFGVGRGVGFGVGRGVGFGVGLGVGFAVAVGRAVGFAVARGRAGVALGVSLGAGAGVEAGAVDGDAAAVGPADGGALGVVAVGVEGGVAVVRRRGCRHAGRARCRAPTGGDKEGHGREPRHVAVEHRGIVATNPRQPAVERFRLPSDDAQPTRRGDEPVPAAAREQPGGLVPVGSGRPGPREAPRSPDLPEHRLRRVPLVPRHGARIVRGRGDGRLPQRAFRRDQGRPRGAPRPRPGVHGGRAGDQRQRRVADVRLPDPGRAAVLRRHVLPERAASRDAVVPPGARRRRSGVARGSRRGGSGRRTARPGPRRTGAGCRPRTTIRAMPCWRRQRRRSRHRSIRATAAGGGRPSSRSR